MQRLRFALLTILASGTLAASAQDITEAYNLSNLTVQGTARSMGYGNALGSVGGDFSSLSVNPAGLGVYRSSELTFTPSLRINSAGSEYLNTTAADNNTHFNINNFGIVLTSAPKGKRYDQRNWKAISFAFGMNRSADFNRNYTYQGRNTTSSGSQAFESDANAYPADARDINASGTLAYMGYNSYLVNQNAAGSFYSIVPFTNGVDQQKSVHESGGVNEYVLSLGGNYKEKLMLGMTLGLPSFSYHRDSYFQETAAPGTPGSANPYGFQQFAYTQTLDLTGGGVNAKIGAIYKISDDVRIGAAFHSPTIYSVTDVYSRGIVTTHNDTSVSLVLGNPIQESTFDYSFITPWKAVLSATFILNGRGFITADYEYVDYSSMRYRYPVGFDIAGYSYQVAEDAMNQQISKTYKGASNFRLGGEIRAGQYFMARAGFGYYGNAYTPYGEANQLSYNTERIDLSAGLGFRFQSFFADLGFVHSMYQGYEQPYYVNYTTVVSGPPVGIPYTRTDYNINNIALTVGCKF